MAARKVARLADHIHQDTIELHVLAADRDSRVGARENEQIGYETGEALRLTVRFLDRPIALGRRQPWRMPEQLEIGADHGERRPELVRGVGHEALLRRVSAGQAREHLVEGRREATQLIPGGARRDSTRELARPRDRSGRLGQDSHRSESMARQEPSHGERDDGAHHRHEQHEASEPAHRGIEMRQRLSGGEHPRAVRQTSPVHPPATAGGVDDEAEGAVTADRLVERRQQADE